MGWAGRVVAPPRRGRWRRVIRPAFVMAAAAVLLAVPLVALAGNAGPGETLYGLKLGVEKLQLALERDPSGDVRLHLEFAGRRLAEASQLFAEGRPAEVDGALVNARSHRRAAGKGVDLLLERKAAPEEIEQQFAPVITQQLERIAELSVKAGCNRADPGAVEPQCKGLLTALEQSQRLLEKVRGSDDRQKTSPEKERTPSPHENPASPQRTPARESPRS